MHRNGQAMSGRSIAVWMNGMLQQSHVRTHACVITIVATCTVKMNLQGFLKITICMALHTLSDSINTLCIVVWHKTKISNNKTCLNETTLCSLCWPCWCIMTKTFDTTTKCFSIETSEQKQLVPDHCDKFHLGLQLLEITG